MKIKEITDLAIRELAVLRFREDFKPNHLPYSEIVDKELNAAFIWNNTSEGHKFWSRVNVDIEQRNYMSTYDFVGENNLEKEAAELFGEDWEAEDDAEQIDRLLKFIGFKHYEVRFIDTRSDYDMEVKFNPDKERIEELEKELRHLKASIQKLIK